ncbi:DUF397 domain-containing protein [Nocardia terpenica]|uniref:DUF397 domain-containing protein n=1 Tax=Nocardia terpenica TaxID=455432 RepID=A0A291RJI3_9NOCA|nr:DUF397 domain-containing protein [Nocardia terpenica]
MGVVGVRWRDSEGITPFETRPTDPDGHYVGLVPFRRGSVAVFDTRDDDGPVLLFTTDDWVAFVEGCPTGQD